MTEQHFKIARAAIIVATIIVVIFGTLDVLGYIPAELGGNK
jgi:hypothetical protein